MIEENYAFMKKTPEITINGINGFLRIRRTLFWDIDIEEIDAEKNSKLIIERVFTRGTIKEFSQIMNYYDKQTIQQRITNLSSLDKKTLNFASHIFGLDKTNFDVTKRNHR